MNRDTYFSQVRAALFELLHTATEEARKAHLTLLFSGLSALVLVLVFGLAYELFYRIFDDLSGYGEYWNPYLMACTSWVFLVGFHLLADQKADNPTLRFVTRATMYLIPFYLIGAMLILANFILMDTESGFSASDLSFLEETEKGLFQRIEEFIRGAMTKIGNIGFGISVGGLEILNLFIAHAQLSYIRGALPQALRSLQRKKELETDIERIEALQLDLSDAEADFADFVRAHSPEEGKQKAIQNMLSAIQRGLAPHEEALSNIHLAPELAGLKPPPPRDVNPQTLERMAKRLRDINAASISKNIITTTE